MARAATRERVMATGPLSVRDMGEALKRISRHMEEDSTELVLDRVARQEDPFQVLVACIISLRTKDEVTDVASTRLFAQAATPEAMLSLKADVIGQLIYPAGFYRTKAKTILEICTRLRTQHNGLVPDEMEALLALPGVGRKTANLVLTLGFGKPGICVDIHVHRINNRLGFVKTRTPDETEQVLRAHLPRKWWIPINEILVGFGRRTCVPISPKCSLCPVRDLCGRFGVTKSR